MTQTNDLTRNDQGMSLIELLIAVLIFGVVIAGAVGFMAQQNSAFHRGMDMMRALQNGRYAMQSLETNLITLGTNLPNQQPALILADDNVIAFNADFASNVENDVFASYIDVDAPTGQVTALRPSISIPNSTYTYPSILYTTTAGTASPGETIIFYFVTDTTTDRTDDYALYRKVNRASPELVARSLLPASDGAPFFRYYRRRDFTSQASQIDTVPMVRLPVFHTSPIHGSPADTGSFALADSIRAVEVAFRSSNGLEGDNERTVEVSRVITFPNAGFGTFSTCGDEPQLGTGLTAALVALGGGEVGIQLTWLPATDETAGETDVARYVIYRQVDVLTGDWGDPYLSLPAGQPDYLYVDEAVESGKSYTYALAAQDCTPMLSPLATSSTIVVP